MSLLDNRRRRAVELVAIVLPSAVGLAWALYLALVWCDDLGLPTTVLMRVTWDEYQFLPHIHELQQHLLTGRWREFLSSPEQFGYGDLFWQVYAIASLPAADLVASDNSLGLIWLRYVTLAFQLASLAIGLDLLRLLRPDATDRARILFLALVAPMPGLMLVYKPFAPDYLATCSLMMGLWCAARSRQSASLNVQWAFLALGGAMAGIAVGSKVYNVLLAPAFVVVALGDDLLRLRAWARLVPATLSLPLGWLAANTTVFATGFSVYRAKLGQLATTMNDPDYMHALKPPGLTHRLLFWWHNPGTDSLVGLNTTGIAREFFNPLVIVTLISMAAFAVWHGRKRHPSDWTAGLLLGAGLAGFLLTTAVTNRVWTWYALTPVLVMTVGMAATVVNLPSKRWTKLLLAGAVGAHLCFMVPNWVGKAQAQFRLRAATRKELQDYYHRFVLPNRPLIREAGPGGYITQYLTPVSPIMANLYWSETLSPYVQSDTRVVFCASPNEAEVARLRSLGFVEHMSVDGRYYTFVRGHIDAR